MFRELLLSTLFIISLGQVYARQNSKADSVLVQVHPSYDKPGAFHRFFFGENYRKEWAARVKLPLIAISKIHGGLTPLKEGGGMQSKSLRLADPGGKEWIIRSVEKSPDKLLPPGLQETFARDWIDDAMSAQHPFAALVVPPLAEAAGVPHANPVIGVVAADDNLGEYSKIFVNTVCLLEEREPMGESDNTLKVLDKLTKSYNNRFDGRAFLKARMLDLLLGDWDRHEDQWRFAEKKKGEEEIYTAVPRDRDQVFHINNGVLPKLSAVPWIMPTFQSFEGEIHSVKYSLFKTRFINAYPDAQISFKEWMKLTNDFVAAETDAVLEAGLRRLPPEIYKIRHDELFAKLKQRRDNIPAAMKEYYYFIYNIADIRTTNKDELLTISDAPGNNLTVSVFKLDKAGRATDTVYSMVYDPLITREIRLYVAGGDDRILLNNQNSPIKLRIVGGEGNKSYIIERSENKVKIYDNKQPKRFEGDLARIQRHLSADTLNTTFVPVNNYNVWMPLATAGINADDGFLLGLGFKFTHQKGFRKVPYTDVQQLLVSHSFATSAFRVRYNGEWIKVLGNADFTLQAMINAPDNTVNFFGQGNETRLIKEGDYRRFYRTRFNIYQLDPALHWNTGKKSSFSIGPSVQFYHLNHDDNEGRLINQTQYIKSYDSLSAGRNKAYAGIIINYSGDNRNNLILPSKGSRFNIAIQGYTGLNSYSKSFIQIKPEFTIYKGITPKSDLVLTDRLGGGITIGKPAFYQSLFLGGQGNLMGYLQYRFAGQHMIYNNFEARLKLATIASYILPGQLGLTGFYDTGRVWISNEGSEKWHQGAGGGIYFMPAGYTVLQVQAGHSEEGWYPYITLNFRL